MPDLTLKLYTRTCASFAITEAHHSVTLDTTAIRHRQRYLVRKHLTLNTVGNKERRVLNGGMPRHRQSNTRLTPSDNMLQYLCCRGHEQIYIWAHNSDLSRWGFPSTVWEPIYEILLFRPREFTRKVYCWPSIIDLYSGVEQLSLPPFVPSCWLLLVGFWLHCVIFNLRDIAATTRGQHRHLENFDAA